MHSFCRYGSVAISDYCRESLYCSIAKCWWMYFGSDNTLIYICSICRGISSVTTRINHHSPGHTQRWSNILHLLHSWFREPAAGEISRPFWGLFEYFPFLQDPTLVQAKSPVLLRTRGNMFSRRSSRWFRLNTRSRRSVNKNWNTCCVITNLASALTRNRLIFNRFVRVRDSRVHCTCRIFSQQRLSQGTRLTKGG